jgi:hypothetical protein
VLRGLADGASGSASTSYVYTTTVTNGGTSCIPRLAADRDSTEGDQATRAVPAEPAASQRRGTKVWAWQHQFGRWRWVAASEACEGRPCICDLGVTLDEIRVIREQSDAASADDVRRAQIVIEDARHERRREERRAMINEDADIELVTRGQTDDVGAGASKRRRLRATSSGAPRPIYYKDAIQTGAVEKANKRRLEGCNDEEATKYRRGADAGPPSSSNTGCTAEESRFTNRNELLDTLRGGTPPCRPARSSDEVYCAAGKRDPTFVRAGGGEGRCSGGSGDVEERQDGNEVKRARTSADSAPSSEAIHGADSQSGASVDHRRSQLLEALRRTADTPRGERKGEG